MKKTTKKRQAQRDTRNTDEVRMDTEPGWTALDPNSNDYKATVAAFNKAAASVKESRFTARINNHDLELLKQKAAKEGIGYQTLIGSLIHKYVTGQLVDVDAARLALETLVKKRA